MCCSNMLRPWQQSAFLKRRNQVCDKDTPQSWRHQHILNDYFPYFLYFQNHTHKSIVIFYNLNFYLQTSTKWLKYKKELIKVKPYLESNRVKFRFGASGNLKNLWSARRKFSSSWARLAIANAGTGKECSLSFWKFTRVSFCEMPNCLASTLFPVAIESCSPALDKSSRSFSEIGPFFLPRKSTTPRSWKEQGTNNDEN